jgi:hypothetical protein
MRFSTPPANDRQRLGTLSGLHPRRQPSTAFLRPSRASLADGCDLVSCRCRSWGFDPSELFPPEELYRARHPAIPSRRFPTSSPKALRSRAPRALCPPGVRDRVGNFRP